ncbi:MAG: hypothetical protein PUF37_01905 [Prevotellaceae bacterium]|nr:hypothetical protein [Prevotellaceae bacterium]
MGGRTDHPQPSPAVKKEIDIGDTVIAMGEEALGDRTDAKCLLVNDTDILRRCRIDMILVIRHILHPQIISFQMHGLSRRHIQDIQPETIEDDHETVTTDINDLIRRIIREEATAVTTCQSFGIKTCPQPSLPVFQQARHRLAGKQLLRCHLWISGIHDIDAIILCSEIERIALSGKCRDDIIEKSTSGDTDRSRDE